LGPKPKVKIKRKYEYGTCAKCGWRYQIDQQCFNVNCFPFDKLCSPELSVLDPKQDHAILSRFDTSLNKEETNLLPTESEKFDGQQLPIDPEEYDSIIKEVKENVDRLLADAKDVLGVEHEDIFNDLKNLYMENLDNFRAQLVSEGPICGIPIIETPLKPGAEHAVIRHKARVYTKEQMDFLSDLCKRFLKAGMIVRCGPQKTSSPVLVLKKPNGKGFRMVIDLRMANKLVEELAAPTIHLDMVRNCLAGAEYFTAFDLTDGYWQVAMDSVGRRIYSFQTHQGNWQMLRIPQGAKNSAAIFQLVMNEICGKYLYQPGTGCIPYLDDLLLYARTPKELLQLHRYLLSRFKKHNVKAKLEKSILLAREIPWIGLTISKHGVSQQQTRIDALLQLKEPETGADLATFLGAVNWMKSWLGINYQKRVQPLIEVKQRATELAGSSKASHLKKINLKATGLWDHLTSEVWKKCLEMIARETLTLAHPDLDRCHLHVFSDASDEAWGGICTQTPKTQTNLPIQERDHEALGFCSGSFKNAQLSWSTFDKEAWGLVATVQYFAPFLSNSKQPFYIHTDHRNLLYIFDAEKSTPKKHTRDRITRWSLMLSHFNFILEHLSGATNLFADLLSRWKTTTQPLAEYSPCIAIVEKLNDAAKQNGKVNRELRRLQPHLTVGPRFQVPDVTSRAARRMILADDQYVDPITPVQSSKQHVTHHTKPVIPNNKQDSSLTTQLIDQPENWTWNRVRTQHGLLEEIDFTFPDGDQIKQIQETFLNESDLQAGGKLGKLAIHLDSKRNIWLTKNEKIWIPDRATHLQICICVMAHARLNGHSTAEKTYQIVRERFEWTSMKADIETFCNQCLHCIGGRLGKKIPRPLSSTLHGLYPNHVLRLDFMRMPYREEQKRPFKSLLVLKDDHTHFCWLVPVKDEAAFIVARTLLDWAAKSKMPTFLAVDRGSHFINTLLEELRKHTGLSDILPTIASNKQTHGSSENLNAIIRKIFRCMCSEARVDTRDWVQLVPLVNHILNHRISHTLGDVAPVELFTGQGRDQPLDVFVKKRIDGKMELSSTRNLFYKDFRNDLRELRTRLNDMHREAVVTAEKIRQKSRDSTNKHRKKYKTFEIGDYILRGIPEGSSIDRRRTNLQQRWIGPYQVVTPLSDKVYICKDLLTGVLYELHADYMYHYEDQQFVVTGEVKRQMVFDNIGRKAIALLNFKIVNGRPLVKIKWKGIKDLHDETCWHPLSLATQIWPLHNIIRFLLDMKDNAAAQSFVKKFMEQDHGGKCEPQQNVEVK
jgi:hypothetical protein